MLSSMKDKQDGSLWKENPEEIKYELSDFLYHAMVLMVERGVNWDDIFQELADR